jgi:spore coat protein CotH
VKVVINGENWGIYANLQQFNKEFLQDNFKSSKGARWKVSGSPMGRGGLEYIGDDVAAYKRIYSIKSADNEKAWKSLINLCKVLNTTPADKLEEALKPIMDVDEVLWFLAIDNALINCDGYWIRSSDYSIYCDEKGKFRMIPHDMNEAFRPPGGPGFGGGMMRMTPGEVLPAPLQNMLQLTDKQKKELAALQKEADADLNKILNKKQQDQWKAMKSGPGGGPGWHGWTSRWRWPSWCRWTSRRWRPSGWWHGASQRGGTRSTRRPDRCKQAITQQATRSTCVQGKVPAEHEDYR